MVSQDLSRDAPEKITLEQLRRDLPVTQELAYFQTGTYGPTPDSVLETVSDIMAFDNHRGPASPTVGQALIDMEDKARQKLASLLNVKVEELGMVHNTSQAMQRVLRAFSWQPGDEFVLSSLEHVSTEGVCQVLEQYFGVTIHRLESNQGDAVFLESLESALGDRTRLVCLSHVASADGRRLPVEEAASIAHAKGVPLAVDGAQSVGQFEVDVAAIGCDFYVGSGHKWLLAPKAVGYIWVASEYLPIFRPDFIPDYHPWTKEDAPRPPITAATRVELGTHSRALTIGLGRAVDIISGLGLETIEAHVGRLSKLLRQEVAQWDGVKVLTPMEPERSSGITTLAFDGNDDSNMQRLVGKLYEEEKIVVKFQWLTSPPRSDLVGMRISIAAFNTAEEVHHLIRALNTRVRS